MQTLNYYAILGTMIDRNWYSQSGDRDGDFIVRGMSSNLDMYREVADALEQEGSDDSILRALSLLYMIEAAEKWFKDTDEPYGQAPMLLSFEETDIIAATESMWLSTPGNSERQEQLWHDQYLSRMGSAITDLSDAGYDAIGEASRHDFVFRLQASHPVLHGSSGEGEVWNILNYDIKADSRYGFDYYTEDQDSGLVVVKYNSCPPSSNFEPVVKRLVEVVS